MNNQKGFARHCSESGFVHIILILVIVTVAIIGAYYFGTLKTKSDTAIYTTTTEQVVLETQKPSTPKTKPTIDPTANWKTYTNTKYMFSLKLPSDWVSFSVYDFSVLSFTYQENELYLGPKNEYKRPPQVMQITIYDKGKYIQQEVFSNCSTNNIKVGIDQIPATHTTCIGLETNGFTTIKIGNYVYIIDELKGIELDHQTFDQILSTFKFTNQ